MTIHPTTPRAIHINKLLAGLVLLLMSSSACQATTYHLSPDGDDAATGTTSESAWKTIAKVNKQTLQPGDQILFQRGGTWINERLLITASGTKDKPIIIGAYGKGQAPVLSGAIDISDPAAWRDDSQLGKNLWSTPVTGLEKNQPRQIYIEGKHAHDFFTEATYDFKLNTQNDPSKLDARSKWCWKEGRLYMYCDQNPATKYKRIEAQRQNQVIKIAGNHVHVRDLKLVKGRNSLSIWGNHNRAENLTVTLSSQNGMETRGKAKYNFFTKCRSINNGSYKQAKGGAEGGYTGIGHAIKFCQRSNSNRVTHCELNGSMEDAVQSQTNGARDLKTANVIEDCMMLDSEENAVDQKAGALVFRRCVMTINPGYDGLHRHETLGLKNWHPVWLENNRIYSAPGTSGAKAEKGCTVTSRGNMYLFAPIGKWGKKHTGRGWNLSGVGNGSLFENDLIVGGGANYLIQYKGRNVTFRNCTLIPAKKKSAIAASGKNELNLENCVLAGNDWPVLWVVKETQVTVKGNVYFHGDNKKALVVFKQKDNYDTATITNFDATAIVADPALTSENHYVLPKDHPGYGRGWPGPSVNMPPAPKAKPVRSASATVR